MNELMGLFLKNGLLRRDHFLDSVQRNDPKHQKTVLRIKIKFTSPAMVLDAIADQSVLNNIFESIDDLKEGKNMVREFKKILKTNFWTMLPAAYVIDLPNRKKVRVDVTKRRLIEEASTMIKTNKSVDEIKLSGKRIAASICCLDEILKEGNRSEGFVKKGASDGEVGYRFVKKINNQTLGEFTAVVTLVEYFGVNTNTHCINAEGGYGFEDIIASLDGLKMHSASEFEFYGEHK